MSVVLWIKDEMDTRIVDNQLIRNALGDGTKHAPLHCERITIHTVHETHIILYAVETLIFSKNFFWTGGGEPFRSEYDIAVIIREQAYRVAIQKALQGIVGTGSDPCPCDFYLFALHLIDCQEHLLVGIAFPAAMRNSYQKVYINKRWQKKKQLSEGIY